MCVCVCACANLCLVLISATVNLASDVLSVAHTVSDEIS